MAIRRASACGEAVRRKKAQDAPLWGWTRGYAWKIIKDVMVEAGIAEGPHRTAKGLRHGYAIVAGVPACVGLARAGRALVAHNPAREAREDRCQDRAPPPLRRVPIGGSCGAGQAV